MSFQIIIRGGSADKRRFENLNEADYNKLMARVTEIMKNSFHKSHGGSSIILVNSLPIRQDEIKHRTEVCVEVFKIMYADLGMNFLRCLDQLETVFERKLANANWDITVEEATGAMWASAE